MSNTVTKDRARFATIPNDLLNDRNLSLAAKGMYAFMEGKPTGWNFTIRSMAKQLKEGETAIGSALKDLRDSGWVTYTKHSDGKGSYHLHFDRQITANLENPNLDNQVLGEPKPENPNQVYPKQGKPQRISNKDSVVRKIDNNKESASPEVDTPEVVSLLCKDGSEYNAPADFVQEMVALHPGKNVPEQFMAMRNWLICNPGKRKTQAGMKRFIGGWLSRQNAANQSGNVYSADSYRQHRQDAQPARGTRKLFPGINHAPLPTGTGGEL